ncbi:MAG: hypothetical protein NC926_10365 [Candidatus Omnitrophica bacterium]|nr:hypothetical protein [Candidatus Omnitrophota bacterium]
MFKKEFVRVLYARIKKDEIAKNHPDWLYKVGPIRFLKEGIDERLKKELLNVIIKKAKEQNYYLYDDIMIRELPQEFCVIALAYPRFTTRQEKELKPPPITREQFIKIVEEKLKEIEPYPYSTKNDQSTEAN